MLKRNDKILGMNKILFYIIIFGVLFAGIIHSIYLKNINETIDEYDEDNSNFQEVVLESEPYEPESN